MNRWIVVRSTQQNFHEGKRTLRNDKEEDAARYSLSSIVFTLSVRILLIRVQFDESNEVVLRLHFPRLRPSFLLIHVPRIIWLSRATPRARNYAFHPPQFVFPARRHLHPYFFPLPRASQSSARNPLVK